MQGHKKQYAYNKTQRAFAVGLVFKNTLSFMSVKPQYFNNPSECLRFLSQQTAL